MPKKLMVFCTHKQEINNTKQMFRIARMLTQMEINGWVVPKFI